MAASCAQRDCDSFVGAVRPGLDHGKCHYHTNDAFYIYGINGAPCGNGKDLG